MTYVAHLICLLDDETSVLKAVGRLLSSEGFSSEQFSEPEHFLQHACTHPVWLAVIDIRLHGMTGLEVIAKLRASSPETRVIVITAENDIAYRNAAMAAGARAFFLKPFDDEAFLAAVRAALAPLAG